MELFLALPATVVLSFWKLLVHPTCYLASLGTTMCDEHAMLQIIALSSLHAKICSKFPLLASADQMTELNDGNRDADYKEMKAMKKKARVLRKRRRRKQFISLGRNMVEQTCIPG